MGIGTEGGAGVAGGMRRVSNHRLVVESCAVHVAPRLAMAQSFLLVGTALGQASEVATVAPHAMETGLILVRQCLRLDEAVSQAARRDGSVRLWS